MADRWHTADGWGVEANQMTATPDRHDGESFRVSYCGYHVGYARSVTELQQWIEFSELAEVLRRVVGRLASLTRTYAPALAAGEHADVNLAPAGPAQARTNPGGLLSRFRARPPPGDQAEQYSSPWVCNTSLVREAEDRSRRGA
jgi:hypothetical protein